MRATDLNLSELLEMDPAGGVIRFAGQRAVILDTVAIGLLRKYLAQNFGLTAARTVLTHFGFAHGWRMADTIRAQFDWDSDDDWRAAGPRLHTLEGLFHVAAHASDARSEGGALLVDSYEADQHLLHFGQADIPVCWTICGLMSGYMSRAEGREIFVVEDRCVARGDAQCRMIARPRNAWGDAHAEELGFFKEGQLEASLSSSLQRLVASLKEIEEKLHRHRRALIQVAPEQEDPSGLVVCSRAMRQVVDMARRVAKVDSTVLITGESGVGKERIARLIHDHSTRFDGPFIAVNCGAITDTLLESELFGHVRGAFTGAVHDRPGLFEAANHGTLLLDEIGEVSAAMQLKLLRVLQEREIRRVGDNRSRPVDVRVLAATNRDLMQDVAEGIFRQDLYYRVKVVEIRVPALRQRRDDILVLARVLLAQAGIRMKRSITGLTPAAADQLLRYSWPGNVRELENAMERAVALAYGTRVEPEDLPEEVREAMIRPTATGSAFSKDGATQQNNIRTLEDVAKEHILAALAMNDGNQTHTAEQLGIGSATLYRKLKSYGLTNSRNPPPPSVATTT